MVVSLEFPASSRIVFRSSDEMSSWVNLAPVCDQKSSALSRRLTLSIGSMAAEICGPIASIPKLNSRLPHARIVRNDVRSIIRMAKVLNLSVLNDSRFDGQCGAHE